jgi:large subunit ribosomal protein L21
MWAARSRARSGARFGYDGARAVPPPPGARAADVGAKELSMYAIIETCGKQYRVEPGQKLVLDHVDAEPGTTITFDKVLLVGGDTVKVGSPTIAGAKVEATVGDHFKGDKVITFKYLHRRRFRRKVGFRHSHTTVTITGISA